MAGLDWNIQKKRKKNRRSLSVEKVADCVRTFKDLCILISAGEKSLQVMHSYLDRIEWELALCSSTGADSSSAS